MKYLLKRPFGRYFHQSLPPLSSSLVSDRIVVSLAVAFDVLFARVAFRMQVFPVRLFRIELHLLVELLMKMFPPVYSI